jgi:hypothetical protein
LIDKGIWPLRHQGPTFVCFLSEVRWLSFGGARCNVFVHWALQVAFSGFVAGRPATVYLVNGNFGRVWALPGCCGGLALAVAEDEMVFFMRSIRYLSC